MNICCRESFQENQLLSQSQNHSFQFKHLGLFTRNPTNDFNIKKTICGMLNCFGGFLFLGVEEDKYDQSHRVKGYSLNENSKENIKKYFNSISECFYPTVDTSKKEILIQFIRVNSSMNNIYVVKVIINKGKENCFYSFKHRVCDVNRKEVGNQMDVNLHFKRYDNESKLVSSMSQVYREIIERNQIKVGVVSKPSLCQCKPSLPTNLPTKVPNAPSISSPSPPIFDKNNPFSILDQTFKQYSNQDIDYQQSSTSRMYSFIQQQYKCTCLTNIPSFYQQDVERIIGEFQLTEFPSSEETNGLKRYTIALKSRQEHRRFEKKIRAWVTEIAGSLQKDIDVFEEVFQE